MRPAIGRFKVGSNRFSGKNTISDSDCQHDLFESSLNLLVYQIYRSTSFCGLLYSIKSFVFKYMQACCANCSIYSLLPTFYQYITMLPIFCKTVYELFVVSLNTINFVILLTNTRLVI